MKLPGVQEVPGFGELSCETASQSKDGKAFMRSAIHFVQRRNAAEKVTFAGRTRPQATGIGDGLRHLIRHARFAARVPRRGVAHGWALLLGFVSGFRFASGYWFTRLMW